MGHVALLGDSIFDNASYVPSEPSVIEQLRDKLPYGWKATLLAVDGDVTLDVLRQVTDLPEDVSHLVISCGGNDALRCIEVLSEEAKSVGEALARLTDIKLEFQQNYRRMLSQVAALGKSVAVCTVYDTVPGVTSREITALSLFNEVILREAFSFQLPVVDLRLLFTEASDYSYLSSIEPSSVGGRKIADAISRLVMHHDYATGQSKIYL